LVQSAIFAVHDTPVLFLLYLEFWMFYGGDP